MVALETVRSFGVGMMGLSGLPSLLVMAGLTGLIFLEVLLPY